MKMQVEILEKSKIDIDLLNERQAGIEEFMVKEISKQINEYEKELLKELEIYKKALDIAIDDHVRILKLYHYNTDKYGRDFFKNDYMNIAKEEIEK